MLFKHFVSPLFSFLRKIDRSGELTATLNEIEKSFGEPSNRPDSGGLFPLSKGADEDDFDEDEAFFAEEDYDTDYEDDLEEDFGGAPRRPSRTAETLKRNGVMSSKSAKRTNIGKTLWDDRENDWLARQLREEARIYKRGLGLDLGAGHEKSCDADFIKKAHHARHLKADALNAAKLLKKKGY